MAQTDFEFGFNVAPNQGDRCMGRVKCLHCGMPFGYCSEVETQLTGSPYDSGSSSTGGSMDLSKAVSGKKREKFENRDWIAPEDLPKKGSTKWRIDSVRDAKKNTTGILVYIDITRGKVKRVMSLRKNFTLDNFVEALGPNTDKWPGKTIDLERGGTEGQYVNVSQ
jgi:hypothetical protein